MTQQTKLALNVARREVLGKKVKQLRRRGQTPANIYGNQLSSVAIEVPTEEFRLFLRAHSRNEIIYLNVDGEERPTFIRGIQRNPVTDVILHIDFLQVSLDHKVRLEVPVHLVGISSAVDTFGGVLTHSLNSVSVEALPTNIPSVIEADVSVLTELGQSLHVSALVAPEGVEITTDPEAVVARIDIPAAERAEEAEAAEGVEGEEVEGEAGGEAAEGGGESEEGS
ncbi:MAG: 50S ribosomal protein L25 [Dehalococcoidia bacterium]